MSAKKISLVEILIWFIVFLLLLLVVSPFAMGFKIKSDYAVMVTDLSDMMQADVRIVSYSRGFFSSDAMLELKIPETPVDVKFKETIIHGPVYLGLLNQGKSPLVAAVINGELVIDPARQAEVQKVFKGQPPLVYQSIVSYTGDVTSDGYMPPFDIEIEQETGPVNIQSSGLVLKSQYMVAAQSISGESTLGGLKWSDGQASFNSENLSMNFSARMGQNGLLMGDSNLALGKLDIQSAQDQFAIHDLRFRTISSEVGPLVNSSMQINAREIYASNERFGPATFNLSINGLNASSLKQLQTMQQAKPEEFILCGMLVPAIGMRTMFFCASWWPLRIAPCTSRALPRP